MPVDTGAGVLDNSKIEETMERATNDISYGRKPTVLELLENKSGRYDHLRIIQHRNKAKISLVFGQEYLVISRIGFGVYRLDDIEYSDVEIIMTLTNITTGNSSQLRLDIYDEHPQHFLILWDDIKQMVNAGSYCNVNDDDLLELETDNL